MARKTFVSHGRKDKPIAVLVPEEEQPLPILSMNDPPQVDDALEGPEFEEDLNFEWYSQHCQLKEQCGGQNQTVGKGQLTPLDITLILLDWMHSNKNTDTSSQFIWHLCNKLLPDGVDVPTFWQVKSMLQAAEISMVRRCTHTHTHVHMHIFIHIHMFTKTLPYTYIYYSTYLYIYKNYETMYTYTYTLTDKLVFVMYTYHACTIGLKYAQTIVSCIGTAGTSRKNTVMPIGRAAPSVTSRAL